MMCVVWMAGLLVGQDQEATNKLAEASKKSSEWTSYKFTIEEGGKGGKAATSDGTYEKDKGLVLKSKKQSTITVGSKTVTQGKDGTWTDAGKGAKKAGSSKLPHELLAGIEKKFSKLASAAEGDLIVYSGDLTTEGASELAAQGKGKLDAKGTAKITVNKDGQIVKIVIELSLTGTVKGKDVDQKVSRTIAFSEVNSAKVEIPEDAKKALGAS